MTLLSKEERKYIAMILFEEFKQEYKQYFDNQYKMSPPKVPEKIQQLNLSKKIMGQVHINDIQKSVLSGTCCGDSSIRIDPSFRNARIQNRHSSHQRMWFFWKWFVCLKEYTSETGIQFQESDGFQVPFNLKLNNSFTGKQVQIGTDPVTDKDGTKEKIVWNSWNQGKLKIATKAHPNLTELHSVICPKNKKEIKRSWLNHMNNYFLMTVWLDDGSLYGKRQGCICFDSMPKQQQEIFVDYLKVVWEIQSYVKDSGQKMSNGQNRYRIYIKDQENLLKLLRIIAPIIPVKEMLYKIMFVPKNNPGLLQRWASEVTELVIPSFYSYISEEYKKIIDNY